MTLIAVIPARSGSKRIKNKNLKHFKGKPLIQWTIEAALNSKYIDKVIVSTDSREIADVSKRLGATIPYLRPKNFALDNSPTIDLVLDFLEKDNSITQFLLLQPTSPLRTSDDINHVIELKRKKNANSVVSVCKFNIPFNILFEIKKNGRLTPFDNKSIQYPNYKLNGALYLADVEQLISEKTFINEKTIPYIMPLRRSVDIDTMIDWYNAESLYEDLKI